MYDQIEKERLMFRVKIFSCLPLEIGKGGILYISLEFYTRSVRRVEASLLLTLTGLTIISTTRTMLLYVQCPKLLVTLE